MKARACPIRCNMRCIRPAPKRDFGSRTSAAGSRTPTASPSGLMLVAIDNLARINESYGFDVADEAIGAVAKRLRAKMRGGDQLGRFSGNKFGIILNDCTPDDMDKAAERLVAGVRDDVIRTGAGPVAVTVTIGGVTAPRHASDVQEIMARAQE